MLPDIGDEAKLSDNGGSMIVKRFVIPFFSSYILLGCATMYQPVGYSGGYSETRLGENIFQVSFNGNGYTSAEQVSDFCLLRSAETAIENGFRYFIVVDSRASSAESAYTTPTTYQTNASAYGFGNYAYGNAKTTVYGGQTYIISKPGSNNTIVCYKSNPENGGMIFDALFVSRSIRTKYGLGEGMSPMIPEPEASSRSNRTFSGNQSEETSEFSPTIKNAEKFTNDRK